MEQSEEVQREYIKIIKFIALQPRTEWEIKTRLETYLKLYKDEFKSKKPVFDQVWSRLFEEGLLDDQKFTQDYIDSLKFSSKPKNPAKIRLYLTKKRLSQEQIQLIMENIDADYFEKALQSLISKKSRAYNKYPSRIRTQKLINYLRAQGFAYDQIRRALDLN